MIKLLKTSYCPEVKEPCVRWIEEYFKERLYNSKDDLSFGFGIISVICWGVAEIPQIIANFKNKSADGVSLAFISTWILGDIFNLVGCILEPYTLPTQFYAALLYTTTTVVLALQCLYYDYFLHRWNRQHIESKPVRDETKPLKSKSPDTTIAAPNAPVEVPRRRDFYYRSARSLAGSDTPPFQSYIKAKSGPSALEHGTDSSSEDETIPFSSNKSVTQPRRIPRSAGYGAFLAASFHLPDGCKALMREYVKQPGRRLLQENMDTTIAYGDLLGWLMAAIYMGGRMPQIWLNIKRGSVEGLSPLMFIFALIANATYVGSILVKSSEWEKIKANMPWLLDAIVCVGLDLFIILQYIYYRYIKPKNIHCTGDQYCGDYVEPNKVLLS